MFLRSTLLLSSLLTLTACGDDGGGSTGDTSTGNTTSGATDPSTGDAPTSTGTTSDPTTTEPATSTMEPTSTTDQTSTTTDPTTGTTDPMTTTTTTTDTTTDDTGSDTGDDTTTAMAGPSWAADVYPFLAPMASCDCHNDGAGGLKLGDAETSYMNLVDVPSVKGMLKRVEPGDASKSFLWHKLNGTQADVGGGQKMPPDEDLPQETIDLVAAWIDAGALP